MGCLVEVARVSAKLGGPGLWSPASGQGLTFVQGGRSSVGQSQLQA